MGERILPSLSEMEQTSAFRAAVDAGLIVRAECFCTRWWLGACDVGKACEACCEPMAAV